MCLKGFCIISVPLPLVHLSVELLVLSHLGILYILKVMKVANILSHFILLLCLVYPAALSTLSLCHLLSAFD